MRIKQVTTVCVILLAVAEVAVMLLSWLCSAMMANGVRSLLSSEGIRWYLGRFDSILLSPVLVWLLLFSISAGCLTKSGVLAEHKRLEERTAFRIALFVSALYVLVVLLLTVFPHAILLSATGSLFPSPFSRAFMPLLALGLMVFAVSYGVAANRFTAVSTVVDAACEGIGKGAPLILIYLLAVQLYQSWLFVFG